MGRIEGGRPLVLRVDDECKCHNLASDRVAECIHQQELPVAFAATRCIDSQTSHQVGRDKRVARQGLRKVSRNIRKSDRRRRQRVEASGRRSPGFGQHKTGCDAFSDVLARLRSEVAIKRLYTATEC